MQAVIEVFNTFEKIEIKEFDIDDFGICNKEIFSYEENCYLKEDVYKAFSLICISLIDLGMIEIME